MAVVTRKRQNGTTYYVKFEYDGRDVWEHAGHDEREARRLNRRRLRELEEGSYRPASKEEHPTVRQYMEEWFTRRKGRAAHDEETYLRTYVLGRDWLGGLRVEDLEPRHIRQLVDELKTAWSDRFQRTISGKTVSNIYGAFRTMGRDARIDGILKTDPFVLPRGTLQRRSRKKRAPYELESVGKVCRCEDVHPTARVFSALSFLTGMREGEVCGRRWRTWDRHAVPLGSLLVDTQYEDQPLKSDKHEAGEHARKVPVHPELARVLSWWWAEGWELVHLRKPTPDDFIVPNERGECFNRSAAYGMFQRALAKAGVANLSLHSTRHTFITLARRGGARSDVLEKITHNAAGTIIDSYTHWDWAPLCEAVMCLRLSGGPGTAPAGGRPLLPDVSRGGGDAGGDVVSQPSQILVAPPGLEPWEDRQISRTPVKSSGNAHIGSTTRITVDCVLREAEGAARHHRVSTALERVPARWVLEATANLYELLGRKGGSCAA